MKKSFAKRFVTTILLASMALSLFAGAGLMINSSSFAAKKVKISLNKKKVSLAVGDSITLKAKKSPSKAKVTWKSSKKAVANVSKKGKVTAKAEGIVKITATAAYKKTKAKASCKVTVTGKKDDSVTPANNQGVNQGNANQGTNQGANNDNQGSSNQGNNQGSNNQTPEATPAPKPVTALSVISSNDCLSSNDERKQWDPNYNSTINICMGETFDLKPEIEPAGSSLADCNIEYSKDYIASVDENGIITPKYIGTTYITFTSKTDPSVSTTVRVHVTEKDFTPPTGFDKVGAGLERGKLVKDYYYSTHYRDGGRARCRIWFPPGYDETKEYNLLFCLHGGADNDEYWTNNNQGSNDGCNADILLDNLYASGEMEDTIVVFPSGVINYDAAKDSRGEYPNTVPSGLTSVYPNYYLLEYEIIYDLLPHMVDNYPVDGAPEHTAICGLSMGCGQSMEIGLKHPDMFHYIGLFSAGPLTDKDQPFVRSKEDAQKINDEAKLIFFITGQNDHLHDDSLRLFIKNCNTYDLNNDFYVVAGNGHDDYCWDKALYTFMRYAFK